MKVKEIEWSEESYSNAIRSYNYVVGKTPIGDFEIEWKSWKDCISYCTYFLGEYISCQPSLEGAKDDCQSYFNSLINNCLQS